MRGERDWSHSSGKIFRSANLCFVKLVKHGWKDRCSLSVIREQTALPRRVLFTPLSSCCPIAVGPLDSPLIFRELVRCCRVVTVTKAPVSPAWGPVWEWHDRICIYFFLRLEIAVSLWFLTCCWSFNKRGDFWNSLGCYQKSLLPHFGRVAGNYSLPLTCPGLPLTRFLKSRHTGPQK